MSKKPRLKINLWNDYFIDDDTLFFYRNSDIGGNEISDDMEQKVRDFLKAIDLPNASYEFSYKHLRDITAYIWFESNKEKNLFKLKNRRLFAEDILQEEN